MDEAENINTTPITTSQLVEISSQTSHDARIDALRQFKGTKQKYRIIAASSVQDYWPFRALGVPVFAPPIRLTTLFSILTVFFGPLAYFCTGMWRKGLSILLIVISFSFLEMYLSRDSQALENFVIEEYWDIYLLLTGASMFMVLSLCKGYRTLAICLGLSMSAFVFVTHTHVEHLHIGVSTAFMWMVGGIIGTTFTVLACFYFLGRQWIMFTICIVHLVFFFIAGVPFSFGFYYMPASCFAMFLGTQALWDRYRHSVLGERFWW